MRQRITNSLASTFDVLRLSFESAGALEIVNEYSGSAVAPARYICFAELKHRTSHIVTLSLWEVQHELSNPPGIYCLHWH